MEIHSTNRQMLMLCTTAAAGNRALLGGPASSPEASADGAASCSWNIGDETPRSGVTPPAQTVPLFFSRNTHAPRNATGLRQRQTRGPPP